MDDELDILRSIFAADEIRISGSEGANRAISISVSYGANRVAADFRVCSQGPTVTLSAIRHVEGQAIRGDAHAALVRSVNTVIGSFELDSIASWRDHVELHQSSRISSLLFDVHASIMEEMEKQAMAARNAQRGGDQLQSQHSTSASTSGPLSAGRTDHVLMLQLDHMRRRREYSDLIAAFASQCGLAGRLLFVGRAILILLVGPQSGCREYLRLHRTNIVDIDSAGRPCKEKMMGVLHDGALNAARHDFFDAAVTAAARQQTGSDAIIIEIAPPIEGFAVIDEATAEQAVSLALACSVPSAVLEDIPALKRAASAAMPSVKAQSIRS